MQLYKVKLVEGHTAKVDQMYGEYLGGEGELYLYSLGQAKKKAMMFNGKVEKHGRNYTTDEFKILQLSRKELSKEVLKELDGRELMKDTDEGLSEYLYSSDVFDAILGEDSEKGYSMRMSIKIVDEIYTLRQLTEMYPYIMLVD